jgi:hypothetical protein
MDNVKRFYGNTDNFFYFNTSNQDKLLILSFDSYKRFGVLSVKWQN